MLRAIFVFGILVPGVILALGSRYRALLLYLWFAFFQPISFLWFDVSSLRLSLALGLVLIVPSLLTGVLPNLSHPLSWGTVMFLFAGLLAQTGAINQAIGWEWLDFFTRLTLVCLLAVTLIKTPRDLIRVLAVVGGSLGFHATKAGLASLLAGGVRFGEGLSGSFIDNNGYALAAAMTIPFLIAIGQNAELVWGTLLPAPLLRWFRLGCFVSVPLCAYAIISTFSRAGFLALLAVGATFAFFHPRRIRILLAIGALSALAYAVVPLPEGYEDRIQSIETDKQLMDQSMQSRLHFWGVAIDMAANRPFGVGMRNFESTYFLFDSSHGGYGNARAVHSSHFQVLAELGYLGATVWILQFTYAFVVVFRVRRRARTPGLSPQDARFMTTVGSALLVSMVAFLVGGSAIALALNDFTWVTFALCAALDRVSLKVSKEAAAGAPPPAPAVPASSRIALGRPSGPDRRLPVAP